MISEAQFIAWFFVTAFSPWKGGVHERMVGLTKQALRRAIGRHLDLNELCTFITETEAVINQRPLTYVASDSLQILRPIDFLHPDPHLQLHVDSTHLNDPQFTPCPPSSRICILEKWRHTQRCLDKFWTIWHSEHFHSLREQQQRQLHNGPRSQLKRIPRLHEVVLLQEDKMHRATWKLAQIIDISPSSDGAICTAGVRTANGRTFLRSISPLYSLEIEGREGNMETEGTPVDKQIPNSDARLGKCRKKHNHPLSLKQDKKKKS
ncbi:hypothetical protein AB6A40_006454 [Gnathostoma spinigerum]|uniref:DUF5641 domain-containing protein n=1 Tax=Gnathostoma spinigerum TaxID=75299 RepID=A0ABD6EIE3_9BILA